MRPGSNPYTIIHMWKTFNTNPLQILVLAVSLAGSAPFSLSAQDPLPRTDIYLFELDHGSDGWRLYRPKALTPDWGEGYHNHPWFVGEDRLLVSSDTRTPGKPDIWELDLATHTRRRLSMGPKSWFSPRFRPGSEALTAISQGPEGLQYLEAFEASKGNTPRPLLPDAPKAGYYSWRDAQRLAIFEVGDPHALWMIDLALQTRHRVGLHPGRQFLFDEEGILHYVQKVAPGAWYIKTWDPDTRQETMITRTPDGAEDFCLLPDGTYLMASGPMVWQFHPRRDFRWQPLADLSVYHMNHLTRIVHFEGRRLALVNQKS